MPELDRGDAAFLCLCGAVLLLFGGYEANNTLVLRISAHFPSYGQTIITTLTALGFLTFLIGAVLIYLDHKFTARIIIWIGTGIGIFSLYFAVVALRDGTAEFGEMLASVEILIGVIFANLASYF